MIARAVQFAALALAPGTRLGSYEILAAIGAGGMGEVYRARDTKLNRDVAIKVLPGLFATDGDRLARFTREAQTLAALNHPNIAGIYGIEDHALVMELVDGEDLSAHVARGPIPVTDALAIARQVASALEAAHEQGIIHRDLKPANIKVRRDGTVKVLDFGLAKAVDPGASQTEAPYDNARAANSPTLTARATQMGMILGTAAYMAPEQAKGRAVDRRADVWAFGCVLFEMLTGRRAFEGEDITDTLAAVVRAEPTWTQLPADLPPTVRMLIERCLIKDRAERLPDMSVARFLMSDPAKSLSGVPAMASTTSAAPAAKPRSFVPIVVATSVLAILATYGLMRWLQPAVATPPGAVARVALVLPDGDEVGATNLLPIALSDDGARVAYVGLHDGKTQIYVRGIGEAAPKALEGTDGAESPFFSPDGQWIAFFTATKLKKMAVGGAALQPLADVSSQRGGSWGRDGYIYYAPTNIGSIWRVPEGGGTATEVTKKDPAKGEISHRWPHLVAGTNSLLFAVWTGPGYDENGVGVKTIGAADHQLLVKGADAPRYAAKLGLLIYSHVGELFAVPWQPSGASLGGAVPVALAQQSNDGGGNEGAGNYAIAGNGTLAYLAGGRTRNAMRLVWVDRTGAIKPVAVPERAYENAAISPDGTRAIVQIREGVTTLWMYDFARNTVTPIGNSPGSSQAPHWTSDGARVIYRGTRQGFRNLFWRAADGSGVEERLSTKPDVSQTPTSVSADGHWLLFNENGAQETGGVGAWVMRLDGDRTPRRLFASPNGEGDGQFSPDGKWIAYQAAVSSRQEIFVVPFPGPGPRRQISTEGGTEPLWSHDGHELFFQNGAKLMSVAVTPGATLSVGAPRFIHEGRFLKSINGNTCWNVTKDGRFLRIQQVAPERPFTSIGLVLNWFDEAARLVAGK
jgi:Tol biopolymer transport system component